MQQELAITDSPVEFTCPKCGASAFEVTGMKHQVNLDIDADSDRTSFLSMQCLCCLHEFNHEIAGPVPWDGFVESEASALCASHGQDVGL